MTDCFMCKLHKRKKEILNHSEGELHKCLKGLSIYLETVNEVDMIGWKLGDIK